jgi:hypothetical protein
METPSSTYTRGEQQKLLTPHEHTGEVLSLRYQDCVSCHRRTKFTCVKCGYCYSCHWKREQAEQVELRNKLKDFYISSSKSKQESKLQTEGKVNDKNHHVLL